MGGCCVGSAAATATAQVKAERVLVEAERRALEAEKELFAFQVKQAEAAGHQLQPAPAPRPSGQEEYLTLATIREGMAVRVTSDVRHLERTCQQTGIQVGDRRGALGTAGRVRTVDRSDSTADVKWVSARGWMPVSSLVQASEAEVPTFGSESSSSSEGGVGDLEGALRMLAALGELMERGSDSPAAPEESLDAARGFHFHAGAEQPVQLDAARKTATCLRRGKTSVVTAELVEHTGSADFMVQFSGGPVVFGVASKDINGFQDHLFGDTDFRSSLGVVGRPDGAGFVVRKGEPKGSAPAVGPGDVVGVKLRNGKLSFVKNGGAAFYEVGVSGPVRFGVSLVEEGQRCTILATEAGGAGGGAAAPPRGAIADGPARVMETRI